MKSLEGTSHKEAVLTVFPSNARESKTIVVLGVERGGTSMVAGMIRALGVNMGDRSGRNHEDPRFLTEEKEKLLKHIQQNNESRELWGFKVPKASLMLDFYDQQLRNPHYVLVFRNIEATVDSWCSRGANDPMHSALHALRYYDAALQHLKDSKSPLLFVGYERACDDPEGVARQLAEFIGLNAVEADLQRAASIVTGEGGGYLDLPEYYFHIDVVRSTSWPPTALATTYEGRSEGLGVVSKKKVNDRIVLLPENDFFPKEFYLGVELQTQDRDFEAEQGLRVYMDYTGNFFPGHAFRPEISNGINLFKVSNNGNLRRIALGPLREGYTYGIDHLECYEVPDEETDWEAEVLPPRNAPNKPSLVKRVGRKVRSLIRP